MMAQTEKHEQAGATPEKKKPALFALWVVLVVAVTVGLGWWWFDGLRYEFFPKRFGVVTPGLIYRAGQIDESLIRETLEKNRIKVIVDLNGREQGNPDQLAEDAAARALGVAHLNFPLSGDGTGEIEHYAEAIAAMKAAADVGQPVLVHCSAGSQRTGGVVACYRVLVEGKSVEEAKREMQRYDWDPVKDHILLEYLDRHMPELVRALVDRGVIPQEPESLPRFQ
ncbi:MAG: hypothetical protein GC164_07325 [Phycisphaera sp.]|nr:hypothetical protein [Phycisphaera sp.]